MSDIIILTNDKEFEEFYYYDNKYLKKSDYPKKYPCIAETYTAGGGLAGEYVVHQFTYIPENCHTDSYIAGFRAARKNQYD